MSPRGDDEAQVVDAYRAMHRGMLQRDTQLLDNLLDDQYTLTHLTGYVQSKNEWLKQIDSGEMQYHSSQERDQSIEITDDTAVLVGQNVIDATIWGSRGTWNPQLTTTYQRRDGQWIAPEDDRHHLLRLRPHPS